MAVMGGGPEWGTGEGWGSGHEVVWDGGRGCGIGHGDGGVRLGFWGLAWDWGFRVEVQGPAMGLGVQHICGG